MFAEHLMVDTESIEDEEAMRLFAETAQKNARKHDAWQGNVRAVAIEP